MKKSWLGLGLFVLVLVFLNGCGATEEKKPQPPAPAKQEAAAPPPPAEKPQPPPAEEKPQPPPPPPPPAAQAPVPEYKEPANMKPEELSLVEPEEFDINLFYEQLPPLREGAGEPETYGQPAEPEKEVIYQKAEQMEKELGEIAAAPQPEGMGSPVFQIVYFDFDKYNIKPEFVPAIEKNAETLKSNPDYRVVVEGHCDERGTTEYNLALGNRRARAVQQALIEQGVNPNQLETVSYGEERPVATGHDEESWRLNRRSVISFK